MANSIKIKRSAVQGKIPLTTDLELGELALNTYDGKLFLKKNDGADAIVELGQFGYTGSRGFTGSSGFTGSQGNVGFTGSLGFTGSAGTNGATGFTGSVGFVGSKGDIGFTGSVGPVAGSNTQIIYNNNGVAAGSSNLTWDGTYLKATYLNSTNSSGDEGGEILLAKPQTNSTISGTGVTIDVYQNKLRIFEQGGSARGAFIDLTAAGAGVASDLLASNTGFTGSQGIQGTTGFTGSAGTNGATGFTGSQGIQGITGFTGSVGFTGSIGFTGSVGFTGSASTVAGPTGFTGSQGNLGYTGSAGSGSSVTTSVTAPSSPSDGDLWWNEEDGQLKIYYNDGTSSQWVDASAGNIGYTGSQGSPLPKTSTSATSGNLTINTDTTDLYEAEGLTGAITFLQPSGTPADGQKLMIRLKDNGTARAITWTTSAGAFRAIGVTLPTTTVLGKVTYVGCMYNSTDSFWDVVATVTQA